MKNEHFITEFCKIVDQCHGQRPDKLWFSTWMSSKSPYFDFPKSFEKFWSDKKLPPKLTLGKKLRMLFRQTLTLLSVLLKSAYLKYSMRKELKELYTLKNSDINLLQSFFYAPGLENPDPFWGPLADTLANSKLPLITIYNPQFSIFKCKQSYCPGKKKFPYLVFFSAPDLIKNYVSHIKESFGIFQFNSYLINNVETKKFLKDAYQFDLLQPASLVNIVFLESFKNINKLFKIQKAYIPFENNPWEKMFHLAKKESMKNFHTIGFQHASIPKGATNYFLSSYESKYHLHPDTILTVGECTHQYIKSIPFYKDIRVETGCALRHMYLEKEEVAFTFEKNAPTRLLVLLDGIPDTIQLLHLIKDFIKINESLNIEITIKEHPNFLLKKSIPSFLNNNSALIKKINIANAPLRDCLKKADVILYTATTGSIEALRLGKAVINYNYSLFNQDPLFQFTDFKWEAHSPRDLITIINNYLNLSKPEITQKRLAAKNFTSRYFSPCTKENIERFL